MNAVVFTGPSLAPDEARRLLPEADYRPPARHGDIYRVMQMRPRPRVIGLVDGSFESVAAVRHQEILWAMSEGIHVVGAASMGALRAAELAAFGMVGVGDVYAAFRAGELEDDDEVAVSHGPEALGYLQLSDAMVDIRATLALATEEGVITRAQHECLLSEAKSTHYKQRTYDLLLRTLSQNFGAAAAAALREWLPMRKLRIKRSDALTLLDTVRSLLARDPLRVSFTFQRTAAWEADMAFARSVIDSDPASTVLEKDLLDEIRLIPGAHQSIRTRAFARALALREARRQAVHIGAEAVAAQEQRLTGGLTGERRAEWLAAHHVDEAGFKALLIDEARQAAVAEMAAPMVDAQMLDALRVAGGYPALVARARRKRETLVHRGIAEPDLPDTGLTARELLDWFRARAGTTLPQDPPGCAAELGFADESALFAALAKEYLFCIGVPDT